MEANIKQAYLRHQRHENEEGGSSAIPCSHTHKTNVPLDSLERTAGHVNYASSRSGYCTNQPFSETFKKSGCTLLLSSCKPMTVFRKVRGANNLKVD